MVKCKVVKCKNSYSPTKTQHPRLIHKCNCVFINMFAFLVNKPEVFPLNKTLGFSIVWDFPFFSGLIHLIFLNTCLLASYVNPYLSLLPLSLCNHSHTTYLPEELVAGCMLQPLLILLQQIHLIGVMCEKLEIMNPQICAVSIGLYSPRQYFQGHFQTFTSTETFNFLHYSYFALYMFGFMNTRSASTRMNKLLATEELCIFPHKILETYGSDHWNPAQQTQLSTTKRGTTHLSAKLLYASLSHAWTEDGSRDASWQESVSWLDNIQYRMSWSKRTSSLFSRGEGTNPEMKCTPFISSLKCIRNILLCR